MGVINTPIWLSSVLFPVAFLRESVVKNYWSPVDTIGILALLFMLIYVFYYGRQDLIEFYTLLIIGIISGVKRIIHNFYLLIRSGECVIHRNYEKSEIDENLISGFLSASFSFGGKIGGSDIKCLILKDKKFVFRAINNLIFGAYTDIDDMIEDKLEIISNEFIETYGNLEDWDRDRDQFVDFLPKLDKIFGASGRKAPDTLLNDFMQKIQTGKGLEIKESLDEWIKSLKEKARKTIM